MVGVGVLNVTKSVLKSVGSSVFIILISPVYCCDGCWGAMILTWMVCGPDSGVRLVPLLGINVQVPHVGYWVISQLSCEKGAPMFCIVMVPV